MPSTKRKSPAASTSSSGTSPTKQASLLSFLAKRPKVSSTSSSSSNASPAVAASNSSSSHKFGGRVLSAEERDLELAIANSLKDCGSIVDVPQLDDEEEAESRGGGGGKRAAAAAASSGSNVAKGKEPVRESIVIDDDDDEEDEIEEVESPAESTRRDSAPAAPQPPAASSSKLASAPTRSNGSSSSNNSKPNAFAMLMTPQSDVLQWSGADAVEANNYTGAGKTRRAARTAPFYKVLEGMPISVDAFRFGEIKGCKAYFLSHFHSDHYVGLSNSWNHGPIYCSAETASLVRSSLRVAAEWVHALPFDEPFEVPGTSGVICTPISANHCPGSSLFHFYGAQTKHILPAPPGGSHSALKQGKRAYLHCGDFRACPAHVRHPVIRKHKLDIIYLDTTYCGARYCFPPQPLVIAACGRLVEKLAPEQCSGEDAGLHGDEDWRTAPLKGKALRESLKKKEEKPQREAMQGWLGAKREEEEGAKGKERMRSETEVDDEQDAWDAAHADEVDGGFTDEAALLDMLDEEEDQQPSRLQELEELGDAEASAARKEIKLDEAGSSKLKLEDDGIFGADSDAAVPQQQREVDVKPDIKPTHALAPRKDIFGQAIDAKVPRGRLLCVVGTYTIGKEKIVLSCARALRSKVYCADARKYAVYAQLDEPELHARLTRDPLAASVHVTGLQTINGEALRMHVAALRKLGGDWTRAVGFRPTGWSFKPLPGVDTLNPAIERVIEGNQSRGFDERGLAPTRDSTSEFAIYGVPYSEHSSFFELTAFALSVDYDRIIATVNVGSAQSRAKMNKWFEKWKAERKRRGGRPVEPRTDEYF